MIRTRLTGQSELGDGWGDDEIDGLAEGTGVIPRKKRKVCVKKKAMGRNKTEARKVNSQNGNEEEIKEREKRR